MDATAVTQVVKLCTTVAYLQVTFQKAVPHPGAACVEHLSLELDKKLMTNSP
ncbi:hypothetical protein HW132_31525 [Brasilonema sp. CT11]|nr:hypothetical protein [Brasilonema sp. CT11]